MTLGSIRCAASSATLNAIFSKFGLIAKPTNIATHLDVVSMTRHSDPVVERGLFHLAMRRVHAAQSDGAIPVCHRVA